VEIDKWPNGVRKLCACLENMVNISQKALFAIQLGGASHITAASSHVMINIG
jgi:hypothetical protein